MWAPQPSRYGEGHETKGLPMKIAVLADIHGNLPAFEAALDHVGRQRVDQTIIAGDIVIGSPDSLACWRLACDLDALILRGNHERYLTHFGTSKAEPIWESELFSPLHWAIGQFSSQDRKEIENLPLTIRIPQAPDLVICHASLNGDNLSVYAHTPENELAEMFHGSSERFIVRAHNHIGQVRIWGERTILTCGSVGLPLDGNPTAQYLLLEGDGKGWHIHHQSVSYDLQAALRRFSETGYIEETGTMGRLFRREVATAGHHIGPFLRSYERWCEEGDLPLAEAYDRFLNM